MSYPTRFEMDAYGFRTEQFAELESTEEQQYRLRRKARILAQGKQRVTDWAAITKAAGDYHERMLQEPGYLESLP